MTVIGLTGGIGSGKSSVAEYFEARGVPIFDADRYARDAVAEGSEGLRAVVSRFGDSVLLPSGGLDRARVAELVFNDRAALRDLEAIVHPIVTELAVNAMAEVNARRALGIYVAPLLIDDAAKKRLGLTGLIVVDISCELAIERLATYREMDEADVRARMANQPSREDRRAAADYIIMNLGTREELAEMAERALQWAEERHREAIATS